MNSTQPPNGKLRMITPQTLVPLGSAIAVIVTLIIIATNLKGTIKDFEWELRSIRKDITDVVNKLDRHVEGDWTLPDQKVWEQSLQIRNSSISVPDSYSARVRLDKGT